MGEIAQQMDMHRCTREPCAGGVVGRDYHFVGGATGQVRRGFSDCRHLAGQNYCRVRVEDNLRLLANPHRSKVGLPHHHVDAYLPGI